MNPATDWRDLSGFYHTTGFCCVCGSKHEIGIEPRFGYSVCAEHAKLSPVEINEKRTDIGM